MMRTPFGAPGLLGAALALLVLLAPAARAWDSERDGSSGIGAVHVKLGASGQTYVWQSGTC